MPSFIIFKTICFNRLRFVNLKKYLRNASAEFPRVCDYVFLMRREKKTTRISCREINLADLDLLDLIPWRRRRKKRWISGGVRGIERDMFRLFEASVSWIFQALKALPSSPVPPHARATTSEQDPILFEASKSPELWRRWQGREPVQKTEKVNVEEGEIGWEEREREKRKGLAIAPTLGKFGVTRRDEDKSRLRWGRGRVEREGGRGEGEGREKTGE